MNPSQITKSLKQLATVLSSVERCKWFLTGGVALRLYSAVRKNIDPISHFRKHSDVDIIVFSESMESFLATLLQQTRYKVWDCAFDGLSYGGDTVSGENHHYALDDEDYGVHYGIFELIIENDGFGYVYTNRYVNKHPLEVFTEQSITIDGLTYPLVSPEWLYANAQFMSRLGSNDDIEHIKPYSDEEIFKRILLVASRRPVVYSTYKEWIIWRHRRREGLFQRKDIR